MREGELGVRPEGPPCGARHRGGEDRKEEDERNAGERRVRDREDRQARRMGEKENKMTVDPLRQLKKDFLLHLDRQTGGLANSIKEVEQKMFHRQPPTPSPTPTPASLV